MNYPGAVRAARPRVWRAASAAAFTRSLRVENDEFKTVYFWKKKRPLPDGDYGAALLAGRGEGRNLAVCLRASGLLGIDVDGEAGRELVRELVPAGLPPTVAVRSGRADGGTHLWYRAPRNAAKVKIQFASKVTLSEDGYHHRTAELVRGGAGPLRLHRGPRTMGDRVATFPERLFQELGAHADGPTMTGVADDRARSPPATGTTT